MKNKYIVTMGDPNGIGPEIILKASMGGYLKDCVVIGSKKVFEYYIRNIPSLKKNKINFELIDINYDFEINPGQCSEHGGLAALKALDKSIELLKSGNYSHLITAPLSKKAVSYHRKDFIGHTEYLAKAFNTDKFSMMLANETFRVVLVTTHVSIKNLPELITKNNVKTAIINSYNFLQSIGDKRKIAVCAFNPHAGEDGLLGDEEINVIIPAIKELEQSENIFVDGPFPADTVFKTVFKEKYGIYIAMYHDQGLGPLKMVSKGKGVNITLGLPVFRISVDHGTAYDIAGKGIADEKSLIEAIEIAKKVNI